MAWLKQLTRELCDTRVYLKMNYGGGYFRTPPD